MASPALKPILTRLAPNRRAPSKAQRTASCAIEKVGGGNARAGDGDAHGAVGVGGFAEGEAVVVARASRARVEETERRGSDEFDVFFGDVVGFNLELGFEGVFTAVGVDVVVVVG